MNRRGFIQISSAALLPLLLGLFPKGDQTKKYSIRVLSNRAFGHRLRKRQDSTPSQEVETDVVIVGGGIAGVSAAAYLKNQNFMLFEAGDRLGGTSACDDWKDARFALGAHYELAYPKSFGEDVLNFMQEMGLIRWNRIAELYEFTDKRFVIEEKNAEQCFYKGDSIRHILDEADGVDAFEELLGEYAGRMPLPTRLIDESLHALNDLTFAEFLRQHIDLSNDLKRRIDYQMLDDWGGRSDEISALAGIHYYMCRPYDKQDVQLFSPPNGNAYFIEQMIGQLHNPESIHTNALVSEITVSDDNVHVKVMHADGTTTNVKSKKLIYAGQKHALPYLMSKELSKDLKVPEYAPWVVVNFVCKKGVQFDKWQNDVLSDKIEFLGLVSSTKQHRTSKTHDVFTAYYCFEAKDRKLLVEFEEHPEQFVESTIKLIEQETQTSLKDYVEHVTINIMGHAMPKPVPGYLSFANVPQLSPRIHLAGVDTGRLPLFFEACDSGIQAAQNAINNLHLPTNGTTL